MAGNELFSNGVLANLVMVFVVVDSGCHFLSSDLQLVCYTSYFPTYVSQLVSFDSCMAWLYNVSLVLLGCCVCHRCGCSFIRLIF